MTNHDRDEMSTHRAPEWPEGSKPEGRKPQGRQPEPPKPDVQQELTLLSWRRVSLGAAVIVLVAGTSVLVHRAPLPTLALIAPAALAWAGILFVSYRRRAALSRQPAAAHATAPLLLSVLAVILALSAGGAALVIAALGAR